MIDVKPLEAEYAEQFAQPRAAAALGTTFALVALAGAAGGLFSVLTFAVGRRRREFGIRTALGSTSGELRRLVLREGIIVGLIGVTLGGALAWPMARSLTSLQYGVTPGDPVTWLFVGALLIATTVFASWRPARQATRVDAVELLRDE